jgi:small-conductance mechanosensitive channel
MNHYLETIIFTLGNYSLKLYNLLILLVFVTAAFIIQSVVRKVIFSTKTVEMAKKYSFFKLFQYIFWLIVILSSFEILGFNISVLLAGSAALLVALGLGLQRLFSDFISGIVLLSDRTIKVDDVIEVKGMVCKVLEINFRTTTVIGRDEHYVVIPNSEIVQHPIVNWTYDKLSTRFKVTIGVDYASDIDLVMRVLKEAVQHHPKVLQTPEPFARFEDCADSSLVFSIFFWSDEVFRIEQIKSELRIEIFKLFKENNIQMPFPQRVVHLKT